MMRHTLLSGCRAERSELLGFAVGEGFSAEAGFRLGLAGWAGTRRRSGGTCGVQGPQCAGRRGRSWLVLTARARLPPVLRGGECSPVRVPVLSSEDRRPASGRVAVPELCPGLARRARRLLRPRVTVSQVPHTGAVASQLSWNQTRWRCLFRRPSLLTGSSENQAGRLLAGKCRDRGQRNKGTGSP